MASVLIAKLAIHDASAGAADVHRFPPRVG